jgi:sarcosine oxidase subunit gamma
MAAELKLERRVALDGLAEELSKASRDDVRIEAAPARSVINLRGAAADQSLVTDVQRTLGIELPLMPSSWHGDDRVAAMWLGPDEWLILAPDGEAGDIERAVREERSSDPWLSLVDVSHNYTCVLLSGPRARDVLATGCALDLRPNKLAPGYCAQTVLAKVPVLLRGLVVSDSFELWFRNSYARYVTVWLRDASLSPRRERM